MDLPSLLQLQDISFEQLIQVVHSGNPTGQWNDELLVDGAEKSVAVIARSLQVFLTNGNLDPSIQAQLQTVLTRVGNILVRCATEKSNIKRLAIVKAQKEAAAQKQARAREELAVTNQLAQIERDLDTPD